MSSEPASEYAAFPAQRAHFSSAKATKSDLFRGEHLFLGLNCFEPGQVQSTHLHRGADKFYLIVSGKARMTVGADQWIAGPGQLIWAPADLPHGVVEALERTVMLVGMGPPPPARPNDRSDG